MVVVILYIVGIICGYLLGSINFAIIFTKVAKGVDIRTLGSGNAGFTNVLRSAGKAPAILTLLCDFSKGILSILIARLLFYFFAGSADTIVVDYVVCFAALLGHVFPIFYGFKGGKGILVSFGAIMALSPLAGIMCLAVFLITLILSKYVSLGSIIAAVTFPIFIFGINYFTNGVWWEWVIALPISFLIIFMHRQNIVRLANHTENKISVKKKD